MNRSEVIENINEFIKDASKDSKITLAKLIYDKYPHLVTDKGGGIQIKIKKITTESLDSILQEVSDTPEEFWKTLITF
tara:strand:+ start:1004 stop:1237 length:234 start_codon:yes stop_codon:yes gene_type:complete